MQVFDGNGVFDRHQRTFVRSLSVHESFFDASSEHGHASAPRKVPVQAVVADFLELVHPRLRLITGVRSGFPLDHGIPAELARNDDQGPVELTRFVQVAYELGDRSVDFLLHSSNRGVSAFVRVPMEEGNVFGGHLDKAGSFLDQASGQEATSSEATRVVSLVGFLGLEGQVEGVLLFGLQQSVGGFHRANHRFALEVAHFFPVRVLIDQLLEMTVTVGEPSRFHTLGRLDRLDGLFGVG